MAFKAQLVRAFRGVEISSRKKYLLVRDYIELASNQVQQLLHLIQSENPSQFPYRASTVIFGCPPLVSSRR